MHTTKEYRKDNTMKKIYNITEINPEARKEAVDSMDWTAVTTNILQLLASGMISADCMQTIARAILDYLQTGVRTELPIDDPLTAQLIDMQMDAEYRSIDARIASRAEQIARGRRSAATRKANNQAAQPQVAPTAPPTPAGEDGDTGYHGPDDELPYT